MADSPTTIRLRGMADGVTGVVFTADTITSLEVTPRFLGAGARGMFPNSYANITDIEVLGAVALLEPASFSTNSFQAYFPKLRRVVLRHVKKIDMECFMWYDSLLETVDLGEVEEIGEQVFWGAGNLSSITIPSTLRTVGFQAFVASGVSQVVVPDLPAWCGIQFYDEESNPVFNAGSMGTLDGDTYVPITTITGSMLDGVSTISPYAFYGNTALTSVAFPSSIRTIGHHSFYNCTGLTSLTLPEGLLAIDAYAFAGCTELSNITLPNSLESLGENAFPSSAWDYDESGLAIFDGFLVGISDDKTSIEIPNTVHGLMGGVAAGHTNLTSVTIPSTVTVIPDNCFAGCSSLSSVTINGALTSIGNSAFANCTSLAEFAVPYTVRTIGANAFSGCYKKDSTTQVETGLKSITFAASGQTSQLYSIGDHAFSECRLLASLSVPDSCISMGGYCCANCRGLTTLNTGNGLTSIEEYTFCGCESLNSVTFGPSITAIGDHAFTGGDGDAYGNAPCFKALSFPSTLHSIGESAFALCSKLEDIEIPDSVTDIGVWAFLRCTALSTVVIGDGLESLSHGVFQYCSALSSITFGVGLKGMSSDVFAGCYGIETIRIKNLTAWLGIDFRYASDNPITIAHKFFVGAGNDYPSTTLTIAANVQHIGSFALAGWNDSTYGLSSIIFESGNLSIGTGAFNDCRMLTSVSCPTVQDWLTISFGSDTSNPNYYASNLIIGEEPLTSLSVPSGMKEMSAFAFYNCTSLTSATFEGSGLTIKAHAFHGCSALKSVTFLGGGISIGEGAFEGASDLQQVKSQSLTMWLSMHFDSLSSNPNSIASNLVISDEPLTDVVIGAEVSSISPYAFVNCTDLRNVTITSIETAMGTGAFLGCSKLESFDFPSLERWCELDFPDATYNPMYYSKHLKIGGVTLDSDLTLPPSISSIKPYAFYRCLDIISLTVPENIVTIGEFAFYSCANIQTLILREGLKTISHGAFSDCLNVSGSITIPNSVERIEWSAFYEAAFFHLSTTDLVIGNSVSYLGGWIFGMRSYNYYRSITFLGNCPSTIEPHVFGNRELPFVIHVPSNSTGWERLKATERNMEIVYDQPPIS